jgi:hypothetical protein
MMSLQLRSSPHFEELEMDSQVLTGRSILRALSQPLRGNIALRPFVLVFCLLPAVTLALVLYG